MKQHIKRAARSFGLEIRRYGPDSSDAARIRKLFDHHRVDLVLDIGANTGQYGHGLREGGYMGRIVSFEPLASAHRALQAAAAGDPQWQVAPRMAVGDCDGEVSINIAGNSVSSSVLSMLDAHRAAAPDSAYVGVENVRLARLDTLAGDWLHGASSVFLKIDTQGYESQVITGAEKIMNKINGLQIELSMLPLYRGQLLFCDMIRRVEALGFSLHAILPGFSDPASGRLLQADGVFFRG